MATHHFEPTVYYTAIGAHEPVLRVESGDTVFTTLWTMQATMPQIRR